MKETYPKMHYATQAKTSGKWVRTSTVCTSSIFTYPVDFFHTEPQSNLTSIFLHSQLHKTASALLPLFSLPSIIFLENLSFLLLVIFDLLSALALGLISRNDTQILFHLGSPRLRWPLNLIFSSPGGL